MTQLQLISYIGKIKAESKYMMHKGHRVKDYTVPGTENYLKIHKARDDIYKLIMDKEKEE